jgi:ABC-type lipoprotein release transport system permease subunit
MRTTSLMALLGLCTLLAAACDGPHSREQALAAAQERARCEESRAALEKLRQENAALRKEGDRLQASLDQIVDASALHRAAPAGDPPAEPAPAIFLGEELQRILRVQPGDRVHLFAPVLEGPAGGPQARVRAFRVAGVFATGVGELDAKLALVSLRSAQDFHQMGAGVTAILLRCQEPGAVAAVKDRIDAVLGGYPYTTRTWYELNRALFPEGPDGPPSELKSSLIDAGGHVTVLKLVADFTDHEAVRAKLLQVEGVAAATSSTYHEAILSSDSNYASVLVRGIDPASVDAVTPVSRILTQGKLEYLAMSPEELGKALDGMGGVK